MKAAVRPSFIKIDQIHRPEVPDYRSNKGDDRIDCCHIRFLSAFTTGQLLGGIKVTKLIFVIKNGMWSSRVHQDTERSSAR